MAERIRRRLESMALPHGEALITITASIGVAGLDASDGDALSPAGLIERADRALDSAKNRGRNRVELWDSAFRDPDDPAGH